MISADSVLRRIPFVADAQDRVAFETLVFATDLLFSAEVRLLAAAAVVVNATGDTISRPTRALILSDAWTMVDQIHVVRQLFRRWGEAFGVDALEWVDRTSAAHVMRNGMDHIGTNLKNIADRNSKAAPLFGGLSVQLTEPLGPNGAKRFRMLTLLSGRVGETTTAASASVDRDEKGESTTIYLEAFGESLILTDATAELRQILISIEEQVSATLAKWLLSVPPEEAGAPVALEAASLDVAIRFSGEISADGEGRFEFQGLRMDSEATGDPVA